MSVCLHDVYVSVRLCLLHDVYVLFVCMMTVLYLVHKRDTSTSNTVTTKRGYRKTQMANTGRRSCAPIFVAGRGEIQKTLSGSEVQHDGVHSWQNCLEEI